MLLERGVCSCAELQVFSERKHVRRRARFQKLQDARCNHFFFLQGKTPKGIHDILTEKLGEHAPSYATVKNCVAQFKRCDFSSCDAPRPGRPKKRTPAEIIEQIHKLILEDRRISAKSIDEQLGILREGAGSIVHEDLDMRKLSAKWVSKCLNAEQIFYSEEIFHLSSKTKNNDTINSIILIFTNMLYFIHILVKQHDDGRKSDRNLYVNTNVIYDTANFISKHLLSY